MSKRPIGLVLAGGESRRMGQPKGEIVWKGSSLATRAAELLSPICDGVLVSIRPRGRNPAPGWAAIEDAPPAGRGPLSGIASAFDRTTESDLLVLACDYPRVEAELLGALVHRRRPDDDLVLACDGSGREHPLVALWTRRSREAIAAALGEGRLRVRDLVAALRTRRVGPSELPSLDLDGQLTNVNRRDDLERLR